MASRPPWESFNLRAIPPGVTPVNVTLDDAMRRKTIDDIAAALTEYYVDADLAARMNAAVEAHLKAGDYDKITDGNLFASRLTDDLRAVSHDKHLHVNFNPFKMPPPHPPTPEDEARFHEQMAHDNCAFQKIETLPGNIGYIQFNGFIDAGFCGPTVNAAMQFVAHTDALIFDIRENGGGQPDMVTLIASYLFDEPTHLIDIYNRHENTTRQNWTLATCPPALPQAGLCAHLALHVFRRGGIRLRPEEPETRHHRGRSHRRRRPSRQRPSRGRLFHDRRALCQVP